MTSPSDSDHELACLAHAHSEVKTRARFICLGGKLQPVDAKLARVPGGWQATLHRKDGMRDRLLIADLPRDAALIAAWLRIAQKEGISCPKP